MEQSQIIIQKLKEINEMMTDEVIKNATAEELAQYTIAVTKLKTALKVLDNN